MRIPLGIVALAFLATASAPAQTVRGQFTDSISRTPLTGAFLTLVDEHGAERARAITNHAGEFVLTAPAAGTYRIRSKRIGIGPNHVLPTSGTARWTGGLSVLTFLRVRTWVCITDASAAREIIEDAGWFGRAEGLEAHARAADRRRV